MNIKREVDLARDTAQEASQIAPSKAQSVLESILPPAGILKSYYIQAPIGVKIGFIGFGAILAIPLSCFIGFISLITLGYLFVESIGFTIVEVRAFSL